MTAPVASPNASASASALTTGSSPLPPGEGQGEGKPSLTEHFATIASAPNGIKKLRELILELAFQGSLVPQVEHEGTACELLKRIELEKGRLISAGVLKKRRPAEQVCEEDVPFKIPATWSWVRLAQVGHDWGQKEPDKQFTYIEVSAVDNERSEISSPSIVSPESAASRARKIVRKGSLVYSTVRPYLLNVAVIEKEYDPEPIASTAFAVVHPFVEMPARYFMWYLRSPSFIRYVESVQTGIAYPAINDGQFFSGLVPLPPLSEQKRIVAKVDEMMALCDQLEAQQADAEVAHERLVRELLATLTQSQSAADFQSNWQRIATHFDSLFITEGAIESLKHSILMLALMGKVCEPVKSPVISLENNCSSPCSEVTSDRGLTGRRGLEPVRPSEIPFGIPDGWEWRQLGSVCDLENGDRSSNYPNKSQLVEAGVPFINAGHLVDGRVYMQEMNFISKERFEMLRAGKVRNGDILFCLRGSLGKSALVEGVSEGAIASSLVIVRASSAVINQYLMRYFSSPLSVQMIRRYDNGTAQPNLSAADLRKFLVPVPPLELQKEIVKKVDDLLAFCSQLRVGVSSLRALEEQVAASLAEAALS